MTPKAALFATTWVHAFEEDTPDAAVIAASSRESRQSDPRGSV